MKNYRQLIYLMGLTVMAGLILSLSAYKADQNRRRHERYQEHSIRQKAAFELGEEVNRRMQMAFKANVSLAAFEKAFGPVTELADPANPKHSGMTHCLFNSGSQRTFYLRFKDDRLTGIKSNHRPSDVQTGVVLEPPTFLRTEAVRRTVLSAGLFTWWAALLAAICLRCIRHHAALLLVVLSMACGLCWFLAPNYTPTWQGTLSNDNLAIFGLMLLSSFAFSLFMSPQTSRNTNACA